MIVKTRPVLETYNFDDRQFRHQRAYGRRWSSYYGAEGGGFGTLTWREDRDVGYDYPDLGYRYRTILRKGLDKVLFDGFIVKVEEVQADRGDYVQVTAVGWSAVFEDDVYNHAYREARPDEWLGSETESGSFQPGAFDYDLRDRIYLKPRRGVDFSADDYTYVRYTVPFSGTPVRMTFDYDLALPNTWPGKLEIRDSADALWSATETASGSGVVTASSGATYFEVRFYVTDAGENTAVDDTVYGELSGVKVFACTGSTVTADKVAKDLVAYLADHGLSSDTSRVASIARDLPATVVFEQDLTPREVMNWCTQFGDVDDALLAWGVELNDKRRVYLEQQDLTTVKYYVRRNSGLQAQVRGDLTQSLQKVYVVYKDDAGEEQRTSDVEAEDEIKDFGDHYRRGAYKARGNIDADSASTLADMVLAEKKKPKVTTSLTASDRVYTATGKAIHINELKVGGIVLLNDFRAAEATMSETDYRTQWTSFELVGVEIDEERGSARLIPAGDRRGFEQFLARLSAAPE